MANDDDSDLRTKATAVLKECEDRLSNFRNECGTAFDNQLERGFAYVSGILGDDSSPKDWIKDGIALWIGSYATGEQLCRSVQDLCSPAKKPE